jgi:hypothetical protein
MRCRNLYCSSSGSVAPFELLQLRHIVIRLLGSLVPPSEAGTT